MATGLANIKHIVVLMLENRSFDNILGWLYDPKNAPPFDKVPPGQKFEGLTGVTLTNPYNGTNYPPTDKCGVLDPYPDPNEEYERVYMQMFDPDPFTQPNPIPDPAGTPNMQGFVADYANATSPANAPTIMRSFRPADLPVISTLAEEFAVCDHWFAPIPTQTLCNRSFAHAGTSSGFVNNRWKTPEDGVFVNDTVTVQNLLDKARVSFKMYYGGPTKFLCGSWIDQLKNFGYGINPFNCHVVPMRHFYDDIKDPKKFPQYSFIEPNFITNEFTGQENDMHPASAGSSSNVLYGEQLIADIYNALTKSPEWPSTLFIITFDEHGGTFDHVIPPAATPPDNRIVPPGQGGYSGFTFDRYGVRVPAVLVSPWIRKQTVLNTVLDHTSIIKTVLNCFGITDTLGQREANANDVSEALTGTARTDIPAVSPKPIAAAEAAPPPDDAPLSEFQKTMMFLAMRHAAFNPLSAMMHDLQVPETHGQANAHIKRMRAVDDNEKQ